MTDDNKNQLKGKDLLVAYYNVDYEKNPKGSNYWRNRYESPNLPWAFLFLSNINKLVLTRSNLNFYTLKILN